MNRKLMRRTGKVFAFFANLKAAFDTVNRRKLEEMLEKIGIKVHLRRKIMEIYKEMRNIIKVGNNKIREFWTKI